MNTFLCAMFIKQKKLLEALWSFVGQYPDHSKYTVNLQDITEDMHNPVFLLTPDLWESH